ncbi:protocatechuate 3,4-dioxygenase subunit alpha [Falsiroseomonas sp. HW251]|uniref:protocatechuate 3,4-dioxygenase subunit alpha n=1 Tax=Falsiroseomonas sp. HW251 TaxID=3390998 RepID=UPI003D315D45
MTASTPELGYLPETPSQTAGPYVHIGLIPKQAGFDIFENNLGETMVTPATKGERIRIEGRIYDGTGALVRDAMVEVWQANAAGSYGHPADRQGKSADPAFRGWGRTGTHFETGVWGFDTIKPGAVAGRAGRPMAPHVTLWITARGINTGLWTRMYFGDEEAANAADPVLNIIEQPARRQTLVARKEMRDGRPVHVFDIRLQGEGETVFFDL